MVLYLTLHPECYEVEQICFSCLMAYFDKIDIIAFVWFLFAKFCLAISSFNVSVRRFINISLSHISSLSFLLSSFSVSISLFSIPVSSFSVYAGIA